MDLAFWVSGRWYRLPRRIPLQRALPRKWSQPPGFLNAVYNGLAFVWLRLFIEGSVLLGSQF